MATVEPADRDDRVLRRTRALSLAIIPFLLLGVVVLYVLPDHTSDLWAWTITPTMTSMVLASAYLGGAYFFALALRERRWSALKTGFLAVALFASLVGIATIVHWDKFSHRHVAFWLWAGLYFTTPILVFGVWFANRRFAAAPMTDERCLGRVSRWTVGLIGLLALIQGVVMFVVPSRVIDIWPWALTPLTCRVMGAVFCLGSAGVVALVDQRWLSIKLMLQVEAVMLILMLVAAARARDQFDTGRPLTWVMLVGLTAVLLGSGYLWYTMEIRPDNRPGTGARRPDSASPAGR